MGCGCGNWWESSTGLSTQRVCGDFEEPEVPDLGQCAPYRSKRTCEAPTKSTPACNDTSAYAQFVPDQNPPFIIIATLFDEDCGPILDESGLPIMAQF